ncbi:MAG: hypothetical protein PUH10_00650 [Erysipelotrichaceae bacterium]|nr:hypothetical protein [Erysipelotrichaceae bacterium]
MDVITYNLIFTLKVIAIGLLVYSLFILNKKTLKLKHGRLISQVYSIFYVICVTFIMHMDEFINGEDIPKYTIIIFIISVINSLILFIYYKVKEKDVNDNQ